MNLIIDGSNLLHRSYWVSERTLKQDSENNSTVAFLFLKSIKMLVQKFNPTTTWVTWDKRKTNNTTNFRKELLQNAYKATRDVERNTKVISHHDEIEKLLNLLGVKQIYPNVLEADDVISWLSHKVNGAVMIVSVDKDLLQLINGNISVYSPIKKQIINCSNFYEHNNVELEHFLKYKSLLGDASDNINGIEGYGPQKCKKLCVKTVEAIYEHLACEQRDIFIRNYKAINLNNSFKQEKGEEECYEVQFEEQSNLKADIKQFEKYCEDVNYMSIVKDIATWKRQFSSQQKMSDLISKLNYT